VKITFWRQPDSEFKRKVAIMMLRGSPAAWQDPLPAPKGAAFAPQPSAERESTIEGCLETIRLAAPGLQVERADFESPEKRFALAERFEAALGFKKPPQPAPEVSDEEAGVPPPVAKASMFSEKAALYIISAAFFESRAGIRSKHRPPRGGQLKAGLKARPLTLDFPGIRGRFDPHRRIQ
jgi:hypothetical protein